MQSLEPAANAYWAYDSGVRAFLSGMKSAVPILEVELIGIEGNHHGERLAGVVARS